jgi:quercetin dioxygenase-like cupin family protein
MPSVPRSLARPIASVTSLIATLLLPALAGAQQHDATLQARAVGVRQQEQHILVDPARLQWSAAPAVLPPGAQVAVIEGSPAQPGLFTMRLRLPDGYRIAPHFHDADEHVTVLDGTFVLAMADAGQGSSETALPAGGFAVMPAGMRHSARAQGVTLLQIHAVGPWKLTYVNASDDPRGKSAPAP